MKGWALRFGPGGPGSGPGAERGGLWASLAGGPRPRSSGFTSPLQQPPPMLTKPPFRDAAAWDSPLPRFSLFRAGAVSIPLGAGGASVRLRSQPTSRTPSGTVPHAQV